ncbi:MAG: hypothetical protein P8R42_18560 [Candidatus Binatia bacterium]|nr:hypothetical protein [Candidatus Binatia bacterium]
MCRTALGWGGGGGGTAANADGALDNPYATIGQALGSLASPDAETIQAVCFRGTCTETVRPTRSGAVGQATLEGFERARFPVLLAGWDTDGDGVYPPMDPDDGAVLGAFASDDGQAVSREQSDLDEHGCLVPVDVLVGEFPAAEVHDDDSADLHLLSRRGGGIRGRIQSICTAWVNSVYISSTSWSCPTVRETETIFQSCGTWWTKCLP